MPLCDEWTDWHLTPGGWKAGSVQLDGQSRKTVKPPADRVLTCRFQDVTVSPHRRPEKTVTELWHSRNEDLIEQLLARYGECPRRLQVGPNPTRVLPGAIRDQ